MKRPSKGYRSYVYDNAAKGLAMALAASWRQFGKACYIRKARNGWGLYITRGVQT